MNSNHIVTDRFSNPESEVLYRTTWQNEPAIAENYSNGKQCGACSFFAPFNSDWGLCCHVDSRHHLETVFEHFTCPSYVEEGWEEHRFLTAADRDSLESFEKQNVAICGLVSDFVKLNDLGVVTNQNASYLLHEHFWPLKVDLAFIAKDRPIKMSDGHYLTVPDLVIKIVTSFDHANLLNSELMMFLEFGTRQAWMIYPDFPVATVCIYSLTPELNFQARILTKADVLDGSDILHGFKLPVRDVFTPLAKG